MTSIDPLTPSWLPQPQEHDYPAAESYLRLLHPDATAARLVVALRAAPATTFAAKDIFRASQLSLLGVSNSHVANDARKMAAGIALSPLLLVRDEAAGRLVIADGYHRLCAVYAANEVASIPCRIV